MAFETNSGVLIKLVAKDDNRTDEEGQSWSVQAQRQKEDKSEITIGALEMELVKIRNEQENKTIYPLRETIGFPKELRWTEQGLLRCLRYAFLCIISGKGQGVGKDNNGRRSTNS